ncbi:hypothetical protein D3C79_578290 [compost metagenome]
MQYGYIVVTGHQIDMQTLYRQCADSVEVVANAVEIGGQQQFYLALQRVVSRFESVEPCLRQLQHQCRLVDLHPLYAALRQFGQNLPVNRQNVLQQRQSIKLLTLHFAQPQVSDRPQQHRLDFVAQRQRFVNFIQQLSPTQFELLALLEFRHHVVVVGVKPLGHFCRRRRFTGRCAATAQTEQLVQID